MLKDNINEDELPILPSEPPEQDFNRYPAWEYTERKNPKWGEVTKKGLIVGRGLKQRVIPPDEVYRLGELGCTDKEIADWFMIDENTLRYNFSVFLTKSRSALKRRLRAVQLDIALKGNPTMLIWLGKNILGQTDSPYNSDANEPLPWSDEE